MLAHYHALNAIMAARKHLCSLLPRSFAARIVASVVAEPLSRTERGPNKGAAVHLSTPPSTERSAQAGAASSGAADHSTPFPAERSAKVHAATSAPPPTAHPTANLQQRNHAFMEAHVLCGAKRLKARFLADSGAKSASSRQSSCVSVTRKACAAWTRATSHRSTSQTVRL